MSSRIIPAAVRERLLLVADCAGGAVLGFFLAACVAGMLWLVYQGLS